MTNIYSVGLVGARGFTGQELIALIDAHPNLNLVYAGSRELAGKHVKDIAPAYSGDVHFEAMDASEIAARGADVVVLALPDGVAAPFVAALEARAPDTLIVDLSADYRFDDSWKYGLPELYRDGLSSAKRIANPGCYATALQLSVAPFVELLGGVPVTFGVSGFSGAGTKPSPKNDPVRLKDNLMPYKLHGHNHEREATRHLGTPIRFMPHVHPAFRGILTTTHIPLNAPISEADARARLAQKYEGARLVHLQDEAPELKDGTDIKGVVIGGVSVSEDGHNLAVIAAEDNLLKGAAVQAVQNINIALGLPEFASILD